MYEAKCGMCGAPIVYQYKNQERRFCSKKCYGEFARQKRELELDDGMQTRSRYIHPDGYDNLLCAIVRQAKEDIMNYTPATQIRKDAEEFFMSEYFRELTDLDGFDILCKLWDMYDEKQRKKEAKKAYAGRY